MLGQFLSRVFGTKNERELKRMRVIVERINALEASMQALSDEQLKEKTAHYQARYAAGSSLDELLPEAFATCREAARRVLGMRHFDVQLIGGITLHEGRIAEMRTGEGKTRTASLPAYLNALSGDGVHVVTVNEYLAARDAAWNEPLFQFLGLRVGVVRAFQAPEEKRQAYACDITYGTNNEFGFDYLRDNMAFRWEDKHQRPLNFAIVDEVDSILIDEARTPLIISGAADDSSRLYQEINRLMPLLKRQKAEGEAGDYSIDEKFRTVELTESGHEHLEELLTRAGLLAEGDSLYSPANIMLMHHTLAAVRAHGLFHRDVHYIVRGDEVIIVDEHTGRTMPGRRWSEGLHQAVEAKEGVKIQAENQTLASTTFQNYFRLYRKLSGMTGTADTEASEFREIYGLDVVVIPTHREMVRRDLNDLVYLSVEEKFAAIIEAIQVYHQRQAPVLVGTATIEASELLSQRLTAAGIAHNVLNAKFHDKEAEIIAQAGRPGAVTIATNMAGRGTDILLGGNWAAELAKIENPTAEQAAELKAAWAEAHAQVLAAGGLHVIGSERHESRRIDNQLRGRSGRQGDPGLSQFYLSLEDDLMRIFASDRVKLMMQRLGMKPGEAIEHVWVTRAIEGAQRKVEQRNFDVRKNLLKYDDVANAQRSVIYTQRDEIMQAADIRDTVERIHVSVMEKTVDQFIPPHSVDEQWDIAGLELALSNDFALPLGVQAWLDSDDQLHEEGLRQRLEQAIVAAYRRKRDEISDEVMNALEKQVMLQILDRHWKDHLAAMDYLRQGIHLRGYAQKNPEQEYKLEAYQLFEQMLESIKLELVQTLLRISVQTPEQVAALEAERERQAAAMALNFQHPDAASALPTPPPDATIATPLPQAPIRVAARVGRNDACPCGSGKKYKHCHGAVQS